MVLLSDAGWSAPRIAAHLNCHPHTARAVLKGFRERGAAALRPEKPGPEPDHDRRRQVIGLLRDLLGRERTWTARQLADALRPLGVTLSPRQVRRYLSLSGAGYRRTAQTVSHKQDPVRVRRAGAVLAGLKKNEGGKSGWRVAGCPGSLSLCLKARRAAWPGERRGRSRRRSGRSGVPGRIARSAAGGCGPATTTTAPS